MSEESQAKKREAAESASPYSVSVGAVYDGPLDLLLSMIMPLGWLERVPTYKEQQLQMGDKDLTTYGFLGYP